MRLGSGTLLQLDIAPLGQEVVRCHANA
jgi:hypothetical protein